MKKLFLLFFISPLYTMQRQFPITNSTREAIYLGCHTLIDNDYQKQLCIGTAPIQPNNTIHFKIPVVHHRLLLTIVLCISQKKLTGQVPILPTTQSVTLALDDKQNVYIHAQ